jgi:hypothetical protein
MNLSSLGNIPPPFNNNPPISPPPSQLPPSCPPIVTCPSPLDGLSCVKWGTTEHLAVGIVGGVFAGVLVSVGLSILMLRKQYRFKKISKFMEEEPV